MTGFVPATRFMRDLYTRMFLTRVVDDYAWLLYEQGLIGVVTRSCGHEAAQVGSAICIERGVDFTLPYYRDLGVVLTIGMTPYEVFRAYLQSQQVQASPAGKHAESSVGHTLPPHWGYHKHNTVTGPAGVATQILHAAGIAFASKLRKASAVTMAYCGDDAITEPDFLEGIRFAALHQLPVVFICEHNRIQEGRERGTDPSSLQDIALPEGLTHQCIDGADVVAVYEATQAAMQYAREGGGPVLLEMHISRPHFSQKEQRIGEQAENGDVLESRQSSDPLLRCQQMLQEQGGWDDAWASQLHARVIGEVEQAMQDALRDTPC